MEQWQAFPTTAWGGVLKFCQEAFLKFLAGERAIAGCCIQLFEERLGSRLQDKSSLAAMGGVGRVLLERLQ